jgi:micrococcal nuclease
MIVMVFSTVVQAESFDARITHVSDGDTLWAQRADTGQRIKLRLQGIDAPELCQAWGVQSRDALRAKARGQTVSVTSRARDDYGRLLVRLQLKPRDTALDIGAWMVSQGHAWNDRPSGSWSSRGSYPDEEAAARKQPSGLWSQPSPERPRDFRKRHGPCK